MRGEISQKSTEKYIHTATLLYDIMEKVKELRCQLKSYKERKSVHAVWKCTLSFVLVQEHFYVNVHIHTITF